MRKNERGETKLVHDLPVKSVNFDNDENQTFGVQTGPFIDVVGICFFTNEHMVIATLLHMNYRTLQHEFLFYNETGTFVCLHPQQRNGEKAIQYSGIHGHSKPESLAQNKAFGI